MFWLIQIQKNHPCQVPLYENYGIISIICTTRILSSLGRFYFKLRLHRIFCFRIGRLDIFSKDASFPLMGAAILQSVSNVCINLLGQDMNFKQICNSHVSPSAWILLLECLNMASSLPSSTLGRQVLLFPRDQKWQEFQLQQMWKKFRTDQNNVGLQKIEKSTK